VKYSSHIPNRKAPVPVTQPHPALEGQAKNEAGGYVFQVSNWEQAERWLLMGSLGGTYYVGEKELTKQNLSVVEACIKEDGPRFVEMVARISNEGRALKNDQAILALAMVMKFGDNRAKAAARAAVNTVCRTGTHLLNFTAYVDQFRGWGRAARTAVASWYTDKDPNSLAFQMVKYQQRDGWSHRDVLRMSHAKPDVARQNIFRWALKGEAEGEMPSIIEGFEKAKQATNAKDVILLVREYRLSREMIPTQFLSNKNVQAELFQTMPLHALIRNLGNMTESGLFDDNAIVQEVVKRLTNGEYLKKARVHPLAILIAMKQYSSGGGFRSSKVWTPNMRVRDAMNDGFYEAMKYVEPTGKRILLALDVSSSMHANANGIENMTSTEVGTACILTFMNSEPNAEVILFSDKIGKPKFFSPRQRLDDAMTAIQKDPVYGGGTNMALPIDWLKGQTQSYDALLYYTDTETWLGVHPQIELDQVRKSRQHNLKVIEIAAAAVAGSAFRDASSGDTKALRIHGFDATVPQVVDAFLRM
jgi:60 kDa SS-A/Ro ribonucleoprotein